MVDSILRSDNDIQSTLFPNIIFCGGGSCIDNMADRVKLEIEKIIYTTLPNAKVRIMSIGIFIMFHLYIC